MKKILEFLRNPLSYQYNKSDTDEKMQKLHDKNVRNSQKIFLFMIPLTVFFFYMFTFKIYYGLIGTGDLYMIMALVFYIVSFIGIAHFNLHYYIMSRVKKQTGGGFIIYKNRKIYLNPLIDVKTRKIMLFEKVLGVVEFDIAVLGLMVLVICIFVELYLGIKSGGIQIGINDMSLWSFVGVIIIFIFMIYFFLVFLPKLDFVCYNCKSSLIKYPRVLKIGQVLKGELVCPHCGRKNLILPYPDEDPLYSAETSGTPPEKSDLPGFLKGKSQVDTHE